MLYYLALNRKQKSHQQATSSNNASIRSHLAQTFNLKVKDRQNIRKSCNIAVCDIYREMHFSVFFCYMLF